MAAYASPLSVRLTRALEGRVAPSLEGYGHNDLSVVRVSEQFGGSRVGGDSGDAAPLSVRLTKALEGRVAPSLEDYGHNDMLVVHVSEQFGGTKVGGDSSCQIGNDFPMVQLEADPPAAQADPIQTLFWTNDPFDEWRVASPSIDRGEQPSLSPTLPFLREGRLPSLLAMPFFTWLAVEGVKGVGPVLVCSTSCLQEGLAGAFMFLASWAFCLRCREEAFIGLGLHCGWCGRRMRSILNASFWGPRLQQRFVLEALGILDESGAFESRALADDESQAATASQH